MFLVFSAKCLPYAELATYILATKSTANITLALTPSASHSSLIRDKNVIKGKSSVTRFFARNYHDPLHPLYEGSPSASLIDDYFDACRSRNAAFIKKGVDAGKKYLTGSLSLADILVWDYLKSTNDSCAFVDQLELAHPELVQAVGQINKAVASIPLNRMYKNEISELLSKTFHISADLVDSLILIPRGLVNGNFAVPVPRLGIAGNPLQIAVEFVKNFVPTKNLVKCTQSGPFINFYIDRDLFRDMLLPQILNMDVAYGTNYSGAGKTAIIEYSSPNIAKPFHAGHLRSTIIGNFIKNICNANGWKTISINYLGDWGKQYGLLALGFQRYGDREKLRENPIIHLFDVYVKINVDADEKDENGESPVHNEARAYFKRMEDGDTDAIALWREFRDLSIEKYKEIYHRLNIAFDIYSGESQFSQSQMQSVIDELHDLGLLTPSNGAQVVDLNSRGDGVAVIAKSDGSMLYLSRDIAAAMERYEQYKFDKMYYVVASQQVHHFRQLFGILELMGKTWEKRCEHISFGMIKGMSTRKGNVVFLEEILNATKEEMHTQMRKTEHKYSQIAEPEVVADTVGLSSIMIQDMSAKRGKDYEFDWSRMLSFEGDTGPYLQYAHARLRSIERMTDFTVEIEKLDTTLLVEPQAHALMQLLAKYPEIVSDVQTGLEPCTIVQYSFELCHTFSAVYEKLYVRNQEYPLAHARLALYKCARITLGNALRLLGLRPLERM